VRVRWTPQEQTELINSAASLLAERKAFNLREAFNQSQESLPADRRRKIAALTQIPWFIDTVPKRVKELESTKTNTVEAKIEEAIQSAREDAENQLRDKLVRQAASVLVEVILVALEDPKIRSLLSPTTAPEALSQIKVKKTKLKRVIVAGTLGSQANVIEKAFANKLDLRFWSKDQSNDTLRQMLSHADAAVAMVGFLAHSHDQILKASKVQYIPVSGGVSQIKGALEGLIE